MNLDNEAAGYARRWALTGRLRVLAEDLRLGFLLALGIFFLTVLFKVAGLMAAEEEYAWQMHWAFIRVLGGEIAVPRTAGLTAFGLLAVPAAISAWSDLRFARRLVWRRVIAPRPRFACLGSARPWRWRTGLGLVSAGFCLFAFIGVYVWELPMYPTHFDPVVLPEVAYRTSDDNPPMRRIVVNVLKDGRYMLNGEEYTLKRLTELFRSQATMSADADGFSTMAVKIRADYRASWQAVNLVIDACRKTKTWRVSFGVRVREPD